MQNFDPRYPEEDDGFAFRGASAPGGAWFGWLAVLAGLLITGAAVLG